MFHLSNIPQSKIDAVAKALAETVEETAPGSTLGGIPETHLYLGLQQIVPGITLDDWQAITMAMVATGRVTLKGHAFRVKKARKVATA